MNYTGQVIVGCGDKLPLTGKGRCDKVEGLTVGIILTSPKARYPIDPETFKAGLDGWVSADGVQRMIPISDIINDVPAGGDVNLSQVGYGPNKPVGLSAYNNVFQIDAGLCLFKELAVANGQSYRVFRVDKQGFIYGTAIEEDGQYYFVGFDARVYTYQTKDTDSTTAGGVFLGIYYGANYENEVKNVNAFEIGSAPSGLLGLVLQAGTTSGTAKVVGSCGGEDYTAEYSDEWDTSMFVDEDGDSPSTVTYNAATKLLTFSPSGSYKVASASVLRTGDIFGFEGVDKYVSLTPATT